MERKRQREEYESRMQDFKKLREKRINDEKARDRSGDDHESNKEDSK